MQNSGPSASSIATFAGGCFWCMQPPFDQLAGVLATEVGYSGGTVPNPSYQQICSGTTGHAEVIQVRYDAARVSYQQLLDCFWHNIDPTVVDRQFVDTGSQYRTVIFYHDEAQRQLAEHSKRELQQSGRYPQPIVTSIIAAMPFYPAEDYHQDYYQKCPLRYQNYHHHSGRDEFLDKVWGR
ncbi:MAG: peptide-methionine (S)-S-oxide reductase MsrA [Gammaproteobacteria bacterium]|nr:peptide-methionine (S)-S-oxide reductase MsrA [Gammaproteobacteria bacterium]